MSSGSGASWVPKSCPEKDPSKAFPRRKYQVVRVHLEAENAVAGFRGRGFYSRAPACRVSVTIASARLRALILAFAKS